MVQGISGVLENARFREASAPSPQCRGLKKRGVRILASDFLFLVESQEGYLSNNRSA